MDLFLAQIDGKQGAEVIAGLGIIIDYSVDSSIAHEFTHKNENHAQKEQLIGGTKAPPGRLFSLLMIILALI